MAGTGIRAGRRIGLLALGAFIALLSLMLALPSTFADPTPTLSITTPAPNGTIAEGPVGANVTINGQGFTPNDALAIGYASVDLDCTSGDVALNPAVSVTAEADGSFTVTFPWPSEANGVGTSYFVCANDTTTAGILVRSNEQFKVDASSTPAITLTPGPGPGTATPIPGQSAFTIGGQIALTAANYQPGGKPLAALLLKGQYSQPSDLTDASAIRLATTEGATQLTADGNGAVTASLVLPSSLPEGNYWFYLISSDGSNTVAPSLIAGQQITTQKPLPTPTPSNTPTPTTHVTQPTSSGDKPVAAIAGLGALSLLFLVLGVVFIASATAMPRE